MGDQEDAILLFQPVNLHGKGSERSTDLDAPAPRLLDCQLQPDGFLLNLVLGVSEGPVGTPREGCSWHVNDHAIEHSSKCNRFQVIWPRGSVAMDAISPWKPGKLLHEGAEATVTAGSWLGIPSVLKVRRPRGYRHPDLDRRLTRQRLAAEARALARLQAIGFPSPTILDQKASLILMTRMEGVPLYDMLKDGSAGTEKLGDLGSLIRLLHESGISHGDLTTHNVIASRENALSLIDFGLSRQSPELEHLGLDLQVLNECLGASHSSIKDAIGIVCDGYLRADSGQSETESAMNVVERFRKITSRVRYHG